MDSREINPWNVPLLSHDLQRQLVVILQTFQSERDTYDYMLPIYIPIPKVADELDLLAQEDLFCKTSHDDTTKQQTYGTTVHAHLKLHSLTSN